MHFQLDTDARSSATVFASICSARSPPEFEERVYRSGVAHDDDFAKSLVDAGYFAPPSWPAEYGGQDRDAWTEQILKEELMRFDAPPVYLSETTRMVASIIRHIGSPPALKDRILAGALKGDITIALGFTEPECGSDVAAAATKAVRHGDDWIINGSKMFTTNGHIADYVFLLARTNPDKPKHKGLTMFLVPPRDVDGFEAQAVWTLSGERTNITFYNDVRIGDEWRIGDVDAGWQVLGLSLQDEHASGWGPAYRTAVTPCRELGAASRRHRRASADRRPPRCASPDHQGGHGNRDLDAAAATLRVDDRNRIRSRRGRSDVQGLQHRGLGASQPGRRRTGGSRRRA